MGRSLRYLLDIVGTVPASLGRSGDGTLGTRGVVPRTGKLLRITRSLPSHIFVRNT